LNRLLTLVSRASRARSPPEIGAGRAIGFTAYDDLRAQRLADLPPR
jgi:hypothetical protein